MKRQWLASLALSSVFGAMIWALSPLLTGHAEPWDSQSYYYIVALVASGFIVGGAFPHQIWPVVPGVVMGQLIYMFIFLPKGPLIVIGFVLLFIYGLLAMAAAWVGARLRYLLLPGKKS